MIRLIQRPAFRKSLWLLVGLLYVLPFVMRDGAFAAAFMKLGDIKGEAVDNEHKEWIEVLSVQQGVSRPVSGAGSTRASGDARFQDLSVTKWIDKSSPDLMLSACEGKVFPEATLVVRRSAGSNRTTYLTYRLNDVLVTSATVSGDTGDTSPQPTESVSLNFTKIEYEYTDYDPVARRTNYSNRVSCDVPAEAP